VVVAGIVAIALLLLLASGALQRLLLAELGGVVLCAVHTALRSPNLKARLNEAGPSAAWAPQMMEGGGDTGARDYAL
jgi:hypothetical protein